MDWTLISIAFIISIALGALLGWMGFRFYRSLIIVGADMESQSLQAETLEMKETFANDEKEKLQSIELELWSTHEPTLMKLEEKIEELGDILTEKNNKNERVRRDMQKKKSEIENTFKQKSAFFERVEQRIEAKRLEGLNLKKKMSEVILQRFNKNREEAIAENADLMIQEAQSESLRKIERSIEEVHLQSEYLAKRVLDIALHRFARPYCDERGIGGVYFPNPQSRQILCDPKGENIKFISTLTGCDLFVDDSMEVIGVAGFDPVRRELTRQLLERLVQEKRPIQQDFIKKVFEQKKRDLFRAIQKDGDLLAREMKIPNFNAEVRMMLGSLRYRYSFTQNQYFHVAEVGWLAGLLASEVAAEINVSRRSGVLHDIGKAMDHQMEGGHAMIGADFVEKRGEREDIVHNVRAHHFDVQPSTDEAFILIAADAISGARPGARRSTMETYNQKVSDLQEIARSFRGVTDCFVLNGGRECRVLVNSRVVDDHQALTMSRDIAKKIEDECNYPGQIRVVVVRETIVTESTKVPS